MDVAQLARAPLRPACPRHPGSRVRLDGYVHSAWSEAHEDGGATSEFAIRMMLRLVEAFVPRLLLLNWSVELDRQEQFVTSDTPVVVWRKPTPMDEFEGIGIDNAAELRFPLDPGKQLALSKRPRKPVMWVEPHRVRRSNADMADGCHRFLVGNPANRQLLDRLRLPSRAPVIRFNVGPLVVEGPDGRKIRDSEVLHMFYPRRALGH